MRVPCPLDVKLVQYFLFRNSDAVGIGQYFEPKIDDSDRNLEISSPSDLDAKEDHSALQHLPPFKEMAAYKHTPSVGIGLNDDNVDWR